MLNLNSLLLFSENPSALATFYKKVLNGEPIWEGGGYTGFTFGSGTLMIGPHDKVHGTNKNPERLMFNFETTDVNAEFKRIKDIGARVIAKPYQPEEGKDMWIATFADPDGNYFQLGSPMQ